MKIGTAYSNAIKQQHATRMSYSNTTPDGLGYKFHECSKTPCIFPQYKGNTVILIDGMCFQLSLYVQNKHSLASIVLLNMQLSKEMYALQ